MNKFVSGIENGVSEEAADIALAKWLSGEPSRFELARRAPKLAAPAIIKVPRITRLQHDFETYCDLDIRKVGSDAYTRHSSCEILMCAYAINQEDVEQWVPVEGEGFPAKLEDALLDERVVKTAWNKSFEYQVWKNVWGLVIPHEQWRCTQALSFSLALPGKLEKAGEVVDIPQDLRKQATGRALIRLFTQPRKATKTKPWTRTEWWREPVKWEEFKDYNRSDVLAERAILRKLLPFDMPPEEWELWVIDQIINERGIPINIEVVESAIRLYDHAFEDRTEKLKEVTGLANPGSPAQLLPWLQDHGYVFDDCQKGHIKRARDETRARIGTAAEMFNDAPLARALTLRGETARTSPKKYFTLERCVDRVDRVLRNAFQFAGAGRTWRWAGRMVQVHNLPRPDKLYKKIIEIVVAHLERLEPEILDQIYDNPFDLLASCVRSAIQAPDGYILYDADLNAIENRVLGWIAIERKILRVFELGRDPYIDFATFMYHQDYDTLWHEYKVLEDDGKRTISKPAVLGCGYQLGPGEEKVNRKTGEIEATGLLGYARNMNVIMTVAQAAEAVRVFRETYEEVVEAWKGLEKAFKRTIRTGLPSEFNMIRFDMKAPFARMVLPSGRALHYCRPRIEPVKAPWGEWRDSITYEQQENNQWQRVSTHGGKIMENADQAIARDLLAHGMKLAHRRGLDLRLHVHDQLVGMARLEVGEEHLEILQECMSDEPKWSVFKGTRLPIGSNGFLTKIWKKD